MCFQWKWTASCIDIRLLVITNAKAILAECKSLSVDVHSGFFLLFGFFVSYIIIVLRHIFFRVCFFCIKLQTIDWFSLNLATGISHWSMRNTLPICYWLLFTILVNVMISAQCFSFQTATENAVKNICFFNLWFFEIRRRLRISLCLVFAFIQERCFPCSFIAIH